MLVPAKPLLHLTPLISEPRAALQPPWHATSFFPSGCDALVAALEHLQVPPGSEVVLPALICRSVPESLERCGLTPSFVDAAQSSPMPSPDDLGRACDAKEARALLLVDFFGFLPPDRASLAKRARSAGCVLIEDRCHSALTQPSEEIAEAVTYSLRKSLPSADSGALWLAGQAAPNTPSGALPAYQSVPFMVLRLAERLVCGLGWPNIYGERVAATRRRPPEKTAPEIAGSKAPSWLLARQLRSATVLTRAAEQRRENYSRLAELLEGSGGLLFAPPDVGTVPQIFPLRDCSGGLVRYLRRHGVGAYRWPGEDLPLAVREVPGRFPNANRLNRETVCMPLHQSVNATHIERMAMLVKRYYEAGE